MIALLTNDFFLVKVFTQILNVLLNLILKLNILKQ